MEPKREIRKNATLFPNIIWIFRQILVDGNWKNFKEQFGVGT